jgi:enoyl-[acyl-carrier protein] reductase I
MNRTPSELEATQRTSFPSLSSAVHSRLMLPIDLTGKRALVAGVSDDGGFGFAIAKALAEAGANICLGSWPPALGIFTKLLERGKMDESMRLGDGRKLEFERIYPLDAAFDSLDEVPAEIRDNKRYKEVGDFSIQGMTQRIRDDFGENGLDIVVHSLANAPEVKSPLVDTSRQGYLSAISVSAYSNISLVRHLAPLMSADGAFLSLSYMAGERVIPGYGGGMSSAKAALEADTRTLAFEAGRRWGVRVNAISAGPWASRAATAIGFIDTMIEYTSRNSPLPRPIDAADVGSTAAFLCSPLARAITGSVVYVDNGYHVMGMAVVGGEQ